MGQILTNGNGHTMNKYPITDAVDFANDIGELTRQSYGAVRFGMTLENVERSMSKGTLVSKAASSYRTVGTTFLVVGSTVALYQFIDSDHSGGDWAKLGVNAGIIAIGFIPVVGPFASIGLGVAENMGAFDKVYDLADHPNVINFYWSNPSLIFK